MQIIELRGDENIAVIRERVERATAQDVALVVPPGCEALEGNRVHLAVLRRWADAAAVRLVLVVSDSATEVLAREVGLIVARSVPRAQALDLERLYRQRRRGPGLLSAFRIRPGMAPARPPGRLAWVPGIYRLPVIGASAIFVIVFLFVLVFPSAIVTITPASKPLSASMEITAVNGLARADVATRQVPARTVTVEQQASDTIATTSKQDVPDGHAQGMVVFANKSSNAVRIPKGTVVSTSFGRSVRFYTVADVSLSGEVHRTVRVGVLAAEPGPGGNVPPLTINTVEGELAAQIDVLNDARTEGGSVRRVSAVDAQDKVALRAKLMEKVQREAYQQLTNALSLEEFVPPASLTVTLLGEEFDHKVGEVTDTLQMTVKVQVKGLAVSGAAGQQLLTRELQQKLPKGYRLVTHSLQFKRGDILEATADQARFGMTAEATMAQVIDAWTVRRTIAGKPLDQAQQALTKAYALPKPPRIELQSCLFGHLPWATPRIRVVDALE